MSTSRDPVPRLLSAATKHYGRYGDFADFGTQSSGHASVGFKSLGKISIDCEFLFEKSQWGVLGHKQFPAGIIYVNLNFGPPQGCRVKSATITITLDEHDPALEDYGADRELHPSGCPVQVTAWYGPKELNGQIKTAYTEATKKLVPEINALGNGAGGLGYESKKLFRHQARWSFNGQLLPGKDTWVYKTLRWDLNENELERQALHSSTVRTAFAFEHSGQSFLMKVDIDGKLESWNDRVKSKFRFGSSRARERNIVTLLDFEDYKIYTKNLDRTAMGLARAMEMENLQEIPVQIPDEIPGTRFYPATTSDTSDGASTGAAEIVQNVQSPGNTPLLGYPPQGGPEFGLLGPGAAAVPNLPGLPTIEEFREIIDGLSERQEVQITRIPGLESVTTMDTDQTLIGTDENSIVAEEPDQSQSQESSISTGRQMPDQAQPTSREIKEDVLGLNGIRHDELDSAELLKLPAVLVLLQFFARVMHILGYTPRVIRNVRQADDTNRPADPKTKSLS
ncbi:hypothetical protein Daus18300_012377 [Diaporthe australafricana]|uniref:Uncharacterized protein n=1 Tax=Diaporthe australafricana TaxID=127596 RepID=A0ABR3W2Z6_9PEZI